MERDSVVTGRVLTKPTVSHPQHEIRTLERLDGLVQQAAVRRQLDSTADRLVASLATDRSSTLVWEPIDLSLNGAEAPPGIRSSWMFVLRRNTVSGAERHPNSVQRVMSYRGTADLQTRPAGRWLSKPPGWSDGCAAGESLAFDSVRCMASRSDGRGALGRRFVSYRAGRGADRRASGRGGSGNDPASLPRVKRHGTRDCATGGGGDRRVDAPPARAGAPRARRTDGSGLPGGADRARLPALRRLRRCRSVACRHRARTPGRPHRRRAGGETSYDYFPPSREMTLSPAALTAIRSVLDEAGNRCPTTCRAATTLDPARGQVKPRAAVRRRLRGARTQTPCGRCPVERPRSRERRRATS